MIIAVDNGNAYTKTPSTAFSSGVKEFSARPPIMSNDLIEFNNKFYCLVNERLTYVKDKTKDDNLLILTLFGIAKEIRYRNENTKNEIILAVGLPPGHFALLKDKFRNYFLNHGEAIKFKYNETPYSIKIKDVHVFPQSFSAVATIAEQIQKYTRSYVIDIGGYTIDTLLLTDGRPDLNYVESLELGVIDMFNTIKRNVSVMYDIKLADSDIEELMSENKRNNVLSDNEDIKNEIYKVAKKHTEEIINQLRERGIDLKSTYAIFVGGGSVLLQDFIKDNDKISKFFILDNNKANAQGYQALAERLEEIKE